MYNRYCEVVSNCLKGKRNQNGVKGKGRKGKERKFQLAVPLVSVISLKKKVHANINWRFYYAQDLYFE